MLALCVLIAMLLAPLLHHNPVADCACFLCAGHGLLPVRLSRHGWRRWGGCLASFLESRLVTSMLYTCKQTHLATIGRRWQHGCPVVIRTSHAQCLSTCLSSVFESHFSHASWKEQEVNGNEGCRRCMAALQHSGRGMPSAARMAGSTAGMTPPIPPAWTIPGFHLNRTASSPVCRQHQQPYCSQCTVAQHVPLDDRYTSCSHTHKICCGPTCSTVRNMAQFQEPRRAKLGRKPL